MNCQQHRTRTTFTSNVMGEYRTRRITEHFTYMRKLKAWRGEMASQLAVWRGGFRKLQFQQWEEKRQQDVISAAADAAKVAHRLAEKQHEQLLETIRKVTNEHAVAELRLEKAIKEEKRVEDREQGMALRRAMLLEASRDWVGPEELGARIEEALDNPSPFGFISKQPRTTGF
ncbi:MAG: hypothetical protein WDW36_009714 [Sanguina aurantia]